ncbi:MAG: hypothetical protein Udaeo2_25520 [Candidatus Udaeobacter sp.]|nr:MAG: hypothetical protein Udaeo2_25520 [Candidatus Udaeobacter sp.]
MHLRHVGSSCASRMMSRHCGQFASSPSQCIFNLFVGAHSRADSGSRVVACARAGPCGRFTQVLLGLASREGDVNVRSHKNGHSNITPDFVSCVAVILLFLWTAGPASAQPQCKRTITASVVALPQPIMLNRLGAAIPDGLIFALKSDTESNSGPTQLKPTKRPRPLVLRANVGDCLTITFENAIPQSQFRARPTLGFRPILQRALVAHSRRGVGCRRPG